MYSAIELLRQDFYKDCGETELGVTSICLRPFDPSTYPRRRLQDERNCAGPIQADEIDISNLIDSLPSFFSQWLSTHKRVHSIYEKEKNKADWSTKSR